MIKDISERVQRSTIGMVDIEEKIMLTRVEFQDALAELTLPDVTQRAVVTAGAAIATPAALELKK